MADELDSDFDDGPEPHNLALPPELTAAPAAETCGYSWRHRGELVRCSQDPDHDAPEHVVWRNGQVLTVRACRGDRSCRAAASAAGRRALPAAPLSARCACSASGAAALPDMH